MKLSELMAGVTPSPDFEGVATAGDYVLAVDFSGAAENPGDYIVADGGVTEQSGPRICRFRRQKSFRMLKPPAGIG